MRSDLAELLEVVEQLPPELAHEVLKYAQFLRRKHAQAATAEPGDDDSHYGASGEGFDFLDRWDAIESPMGKRDVA
jgi:hypothetical protein